MWQFILRRIALLGVVIFGVTVLTFTLMHFTPGDPATIIAIARYGGIESLSPDVIEWIRHQEGLDAPVYVQFARWAGHMVHGDFGKSLITEEPVMEKILSRFPATLWLALAGMLISLLISLPLGIYSAVRQNSAADYLGMAGRFSGFPCPTSGWR